MRCRSSGLGDSKCLLVTSLAVLFAFGSDSRAAILNVSTSGFSFSSIGAAIVAAKSGDTIAIARGTYFENLVIRKRLTLSGSGISQTIIDGSQTSRVVTIASNVTVVMQNLSIQNGMVTGAPGQSVFGGGIFNEGFLTLRNIAVISNTISGGHALEGETGGQAQGGGVCSRGRLSMNACSVIGNHAVSGGGLYSENIRGTGGDASGAGVYSDGRLDVVQSVFHDNTAWGGSESAVTEAGDLAGRSSAREGQCRFRAVACLVIRFRENTALGLRAARG